VGSILENFVVFALAASTLERVVKVVLWSRGSPDEARLEQTPYPFQPH